MSGPSLDRIFFTLYSMGLRMYMAPICVNLLLGFYFKEWKVGRLTQYIANGLDVGILLMCAT